MNWGGLSQRKVSVVMKGQRKAPCEVELFNILTVLGDTRTSAGDEIAEDSTHTDKHG